MLAPERFASWLSTHEHYSISLDHSFRYHSRSDSHSKVMATFIWEDLLHTCPAIRADFLADRIKAEVNFAHTWAGTAKAKTIDLAIGRVHAGRIQEVLISCELKACMTEHKKAEPRLYDELSSSHQIVHTANPAAIAAGVTVINIADRFVAPLRQRRGLPLMPTKHKQPKVTQSMVSHLRKLQQRTDLSDLSSIGFDAYSSVVVSFTNEMTEGAALWTAPPAPQPGDADHYETFLARICQAYSDRFVS